MPFGALTLKPGVNVEPTSTALQAGYATSQLVRFRAGFVEKLGGFIKFFAFALSGVPRAMQAWQDLNNLDWLAVGTTGVAGTAALDVITSDNLTNISPQTKTTNFAPNFTTTISTPNVTVTDSNIANVTTRDSIEFLTPVSVGGLILSGPYPIDLVLGTTSYRIIAADNATASVSNTGTVPAFATTSGSALVDVTLANHGLSAGGSIVFPISTTVGGIIILGTYTVVSVTSANVFVIAGANTASATTTGSMNSGQARLVYYIAIGPVAAGTGYSISTYSTGSYSGTGSSSSQQTGTNIAATDWTLDNWGSTLLSNPADGGIYQWTPNAGLQNAQLIAAAPIYASGILVSTPAQILLAYGVAVEKDIGVEQDPLTYSWSDQLDFEYWTPNETNPSTGIASQAGNNRIPTGSGIAAGLAAPQQTLLWTDLDLWAISYVGPPGTVFSQTKIGSNCGAISRHGVAQMGGIVYWWGRNNFYALTGGGPQVIPCTVWDVVFQDLDADNTDKCWIETVTSFNEVWFWFPSESGGLGQCDTYAKVNVLDGSWDYGTLSRSIGIDQSVLGNPIMATPTGVLYSHETGYNNDGQPLVWSFTTGWTYIAEGEDFVVVDQFLPDFKYGLFNGADTAIIQITFEVIDNQGDTPRSYGPYSMSASTNKLDVRFRGRQVRITMTANDLNTFVRLGKCRFRFALSGRR